MGATACSSREREEEDACPGDEPPRTCGFSSGRPRHSPGEAETSRHSPARFDEVLGELTVAQESNRRLERENRVLKDENTRLQEQLAGLKMRLHSDGSAHACGRNGSKAIGLSASEYDFPRTASSGSDCRGRSPDGAYLRRRKNSTCGETPRAFGNHGKVSFADRDHHELANDLLRGTWPFVSSWFEDKMRAQVEPLIQAAMPAGISISFGENCHLGSEPVVLKDIETFKYVHPGAQGEEDSTNLRVVANIEYTGNGVIEAIMSAGHVVINGMEIRGTLVFEFAHLLNTPPFFGGLRIFFANAPAIDLTVEQKMLGLQVHWNWVKGIITNALTDVISRSAVLPNRLVFALGDIEELPLRHLRPQGVLRLQVVRAVGLQGQRLLYSDPYVIVNVGATQWSSKAAKATLEPSWGEGEVEDFVVMDQQAQLLRVAVRDADYGSGALKASDLLGRAEMPIADLIAGMYDGGPCERWLPLDVEPEGLPDGSGARPGKLLVRAQWRSFARLKDLELVASMPPESNLWAFANPESSRWGLSVGLNCATGLPPAADGTEHWASVSVLACRQTGPPNLTMETPVACASSQIHQGLELLRRVRDGGASAEGGSLVDAKWECPFLFLLDSVEAAEVEVALRRPAHGAERFPRISKIEGFKRAASSMFRKEDPTKELGRVTYPVKRLLACPRFTAVVSLPLEGSPGTGEVRLRLQLRPLQPPAAGAGSPTRASIPCSLAPVRKPSARQRRPSRVEPLGPALSLRRPSVDAALSLRRPSDAAALSMRCRSATAQIDDWCSASSGGSGNGSPRSALDSDEEEEEEEEEESLSPA